MIDGMFCVLKWIACLFLGLAATCAADLATITVQEPLGHTWTDEWVLRETEVVPPTNGVRVSEWRVVDEGGRAVPAQFYFNRRVLNEALRATRPMKVGVFFKLTLLPNQTATFRITGEGKARNLPAHLYVMESGTRVLITNGIYEVEFDSAAPQFINAMRCGSVRGTLGHFRWPPNVVVTNIKSTWVDRGPARAVLRRDFSLADPSHHLHVHYEFRAGDPWLHVMDNYNFGLGSAMELDLRGLNAKVVYHPYTYNARTFKSGGSVEDVTLEPPQHPIATLGPLWRDVWWNGGPFAFIYTPGADHGLGIAAVQASAWNCRSDLLMQSQCIEIHGSRDQEGRVYARFPTDGAHRSWGLIFGPPETRHQLSRLTRARIDIPLDRVLNRWKLQWNSAAPEFKTDALREYLAGHFNREALSPRALPRAIQQQLDDALRLKHVQSRDLAALAYIFTSPDYWPAPDDFAWRPDSPSLHTDMYNIPLKIGLLMPDHPDAGQWVNYGVRETYRNLVGDSFPGGAWSESPGYARYVFDIVKNTHLLRDYGVTNGFKAWPRLKEVLTYLAALHTPEDPRYGARQIAPIGDTAPGNFLEALRKAGEYYRDVDPEFSAPLLNGDFGSREFKGFGAILRDSRNESFVTIKAGSARSHYHRDELAFHFHGLGMPLIIDHACQDGPTPWSASIHNRPDMNGKSPIAVAEPRFFHTTAEADIFVADERSTNISHVPMEPHQCAKPGPEYPRTLLPDAQAWKMRRYVMLVKHDPAKSKIPDYLVVRDEIISPEPVGWNLHVLAGDISGEAATLKFPGQLDADLAAHFIAPEILKFDRRQWGWSGPADQRRNATAAEYEKSFFGKLIPENFDRGSWKSEDGERTQWLRATAGAGRSDWLVLLVPTPKGKPAPKFERLSSSSGKIEIDGESEVVQLGDGRAVLERAGKRTAFIPDGTLKPLDETQFAPPETNFRKPRF